MLVQPKADWEMGSIVRKPNLREAAYFALFALRGQAVGRYYRRMLQEERVGIPLSITSTKLAGLLAHCKRHVPYYAELMRDTGESHLEDPEGYLTRLPVLTKDIIRARFNDLKSNDLWRRKWYFNTSGGSTGEPVRFIQDWESAARAGAVTLHFSKLIDREVGELEVKLWGSKREIVQGSEGWRARIINRITNTIFLNAFRMTPEIMRECIAALNAKRPKLIVAYAQAIYELARFAEREGFEVVPQAAIITSATTLYPFMRETIEKVFQCKVFNRYGSREVGDIACEGPGWEGLWVAPWANYVEVVDEKGNRVPDGTEGEILVTSLTNFAMPLVRYRIGDVGTLSPMKTCDRERYGQVFQAILGKTVDLFKTNSGALVEPGYFEALLYFKDWVRRFQVIQKSTSDIIFRIVRADSNCPNADLDQIMAETRMLMGNDCDVTFEFVDDISASGSGKYRYQISEVQT